MSRCILVSGFHRSGTSMTMQALHKAGVYLGDNLIGPNPFNVDGHFENTEIVELHNSMLLAADSDWLATDLPLKHRSKFTQDEKLKANSIISTLNQQSVWGFKDPRASLFLWDWQQLIPSLFVVAVFRHYLPCIQSLRIRAARELTLNPSAQNIEARLWKEPSTGLKSWITYNKSLIEFCKANRNSTLLVQQETIVSGFALTAKVNNLAQVNLNIHADTGISASKSSTSVKLPLPLEQIDKTLIVEAEEIWNTLTAMAETASGMPPSSIKRHDTCAEIKQSIQARLSKVDFNVSENLISKNTQTPIKLEPPLHEFSETEIESYRTRLRNSLKNKRATPHQSSLVSMNNLVTPRILAKCCLLRKPSSSAIIQRRK